MNLSRFFLAAGMLASAAVSASALTFSSTFDSFPDGSLASLYNTADVSFHNGVLTTLVDGDGIAIDGSEQWQIDAASDAATPVFVSDPLTNSYGAAPSGSLALNVLDQTVLIQFAYLVDISAFSVTLDNSTLGNLYLSQIQFVDGASVALATATDQTISGLAVNVGAVTGVRSIVLPAGAFYDNLTIEYTPSAAAVPEPSTYAAMAGGAGLLVAMLRRRLRKE